MQFLKISISTLAALASGAVTACGTESTETKKGTDGKIKDYLEKVNKDAKPDVKEDLKRMCANPM